MPEPDEAALVAVRLPPPAAAVAIRDAWAVLDPRAPPMVTRELLDTCVRRTLGGSVPAMPARSDATGALSSSTAAAT